jgi:hypothetical protein
VSSQGFAKEKSKNEIFSPKVKPIDGKGQPMDGKEIRPQSGFFMGGRKSSRRIIKSEKTEMVVE